MYYLSIVSWQFFKNIFINVINLLLLAAVLAYVIKPTSTDCFLTYSLQNCVFFSQSGELAIYYELEEGEKCYTRGIVEVCPDSHR